jgi:CopG family nickel-responsive transcriptional regulator
MFCNTIHNFTNIITGVDPMSEKESPLVRFGVSMPEELMGRFDKLIGKQGYENRSEAIRDLVRKAILDSDHATPDQSAAGTIVMVYDHHVNDLSITLTGLQHQYHHDIISTMHIHLNHDQCLEIIVVRGQVKRLRELTNRIKVQKGVFYAELSVTFIDESAEHGHHHHGHNHSHGDDRKGDEG